MKFLQSFGRFFAMFIDDEEHIERRGNKPEQQPIQQQTGESYEVEVDNFENEMFEEFD